MTNPDRPDDVEPTNPVERWAWLQDRQARRDAETRARFDAQRDANPASLRADEPGDHCRYAMTTEELHELDARREELVKGRIATQAVQALERAEGGSRAWAGQPFGS